MERVSFAELKEMGMTKLVILPEQSQFDHKQVTVWQNWRIQFENWLADPADQFWQMESTGKLGFHQGSNHEHERRTHDLVD